MTADAITEHTEVAQRAHDVYTTSAQRRRCIDVEPTLY